MADHRVGRRRFLKLAGATAAVAGTPGIAGEGGPPGEALTGRRTAAASNASLDPAPFTLGVASGQPDESSVVLWTRWAPDPLGGTIPDQDVAVRWEVAADEDFTDVIDGGTVTAVPAWAHSVHVHAGGLAPGRRYWYRFEAGGSHSQTGRTRTLPSPGSNPERLRFALASCQEFNRVNGRYAAYRDMAELDLDLVIHVGDYIYEDFLDSSLAAYRRLHTLYKTAPELRAVHARFPFVTIWDDHEVVNNWWRDDPRNEPRLTNGFRAYYEHLPMRTAPDGDTWAVYHGFSWGRLAEFFVLDTRQYRDDQACGDGINPPCPDMHDPSRTMLGPEQTQWLIDGLGDSAATWNVIAQQVIMTEFDYETGGGIRINLDQWGGYPAARQRLLDSIAEQRVSNPIVLSGDWHSHWVGDLPADFGDPGSDVLATEFAGTSVSSSAAFWDQSVKNAWHVNPHVKFYEGAYRGYVHFDVTPERWVSTMRAVENDQDPASPVHTIAEYEVAAGESGARIPGGVYAATGRKIAGPQSEGGFTDVVMGNELLAMTIAADFDDPQLPGHTRGKPIDMAARGHLDQIDWLNLPYVSAARPSGANAWRAGPVESGRVEVVSGGPDMAVVRAEGTAREVPVEVVTTYTIRSGQPWVTAESVFINAGSSALGVWLGDVIDDDGTGQISGVPGHGSIIGTTAAEYTPARGWIGMTQDAPQTYGLIYEDADFVAYGLSIWIQSQRRVTLRPGVPWTLRRRITARDTVRYADPWSVLDETLPIAGVTASGSHAGRDPEHVLDPNPGKWWSAWGHGQWIEFDLGSPRPVRSVGIAWYQGDGRKWSFQIEALLDGEWTGILLDAESSGTTTGLERYLVWPVEARYVRIVGYGNSAPGLPGGSVAITWLQVYADPPP